MVPRAVSRNPGLLDANDWGIDVMLKIEMSFVSSIILLTERFKRKKVQRTKCRELQHCM